MARVQSAQYPVPTASVDPGVMRLPRLNDFAGTSMCIGDSPG